jgi:hypothetical protein
VGDDPYFQLGGWNSLHLRHSMSGSTLMSVDFPFGWNIPSCFGDVPSQFGGSNVSRLFNFPWVSTHFPGGTSLGGNFSQRDGYPFIHTLSLRGFFPGTIFCNMFPLGCTPTPGGNRLGGMYHLGRNHYPGSTSIPGGT